jgi:protoporphyrinogen oxidase
MKVKVRDKVNAAEKNVKKDADNTIILGGGLAGVSLAYFLDGKSVVLEKESVLGGLCRSFSLNGIIYDVGPHILFSKNKDILNLHNSLVECNTIRRSNKIFFKNRFVKYPFENDLSALDVNDRDYCLKEFLDNPYESYDVKNMLQFFLKTFGEGMTRLYLQPYNEKIWKFDPAFMDLQMVERIPKPPKEDIIKSANGVETEGYTHQLYFNYPKSGGTQQLIKAYADKCTGKTDFVTDVVIESIKRNGNDWIVKTNNGTFNSKKLINCMPLQELSKYIELPEDSLNALKSLNYTSIYIMLLQVKKDNFGNNFAVYFPDKDIIFHRVSKLDYLGENYSGDGFSTIMVEITYRPKSYLSMLDKDIIKDTVIKDLEKTGFIKKEDIIGSELKDFQYAYVIYDIDHRKNVDKILKYLADEGIYCNGRFAEFEYLNTDAVAEHSQKLAEKLNSNNSK